MKRGVILLLLLGLTSGLLGLKLWDADTTWDKSVVFKKGDETWVKIKKANKALGALDHPYTFTVEQMTALLGTIRYFRPSPFSLSGEQGNEWDLFSQEEKELLAPYLVEAFSRASTDQWIDFSVMTFRGQTMTGSFRKSDGVMFVKNGQLNVALRNIAEKYEFQKMYNEYDPTKGYRGITALVTGEGQAVGTDPKSGAAWTGGNWITMRLDMPIATPSSGMAEGGLIDVIANRPEKAQTPSQSTPAYTPPPGYTPAPYSPPPQAPPAVKSDPEEIKKRLQTLKELYDDGLITKEEYDKRRKEILGEL